MSCDIEILKYNKIDTLNIQIKRRGKLKPSYTDKQKCRVV